MPTLDWLHKWVASYKMSNFSTETGMFTAWSKKTEKVFFFFFLK